MKTILFTLSLLLLFNLKCYSSVLVINEIMALNEQSLLDEDYDDSDWLELYNTTDNIINLDGWRISNSPDYQSAWQFPNRSIAPISHLIAFASGKNRQTSDKYIIESYGDGFLEWNDKDGFRFYYKEIEGDFDISVRINSLRNVSHYTTAGLIIRSELSDTSVYSGIFALTEEWRGYILRERTKPHTNPVSHFIYNRINEYPDVWCRMVRRGDSLITYTLKDRWQWEQTEDVMYYPANRKAYVGLAFSSNYPTKPSIYAISELQFNGQPVQLEDFIMTELNTYKEGLDYKSDELHTNFNINKAGGTLYLWNAQGILADSISYGEQYTDISYGRCTDGSSDWKLQSPSSPFARNSNCYEGRCNEPKLNKQGWFANEVKVNFLNIEPGAAIYYTTNGSTPTDKSIRFDGSDILINRTTTIRAVYYKDGFLQSTIFSSTIFINENSTLPVVSIAVDSLDLWDKDKGIFSDNYWAPKFESPIDFQYWDRNKNLAYQSKAGAKITGQSSAHYPQKSWKLYARNKYNMDYFDYNFFSDSDVEKPSRLVLRNGGSDWLFYFIRDGFVNIATKELSSICPRSYQPTIVFLNGEYWGIEDWRDKVEEHFLGAKYNINPDSVNIMEDWGVLQHGTSESYYEFLNTLFKLDIQSDSVYDIINKMIDCDNIIDFSIVNIHTVNHDWPWKNMKFWQSPSYDGRWRWITSDMDWTYEYIDDQSYGRATDTSSFFGKIFAQLIKNEQFKINLVNRTADLLNTTFLPDRVVNIFDSLVAQVSLEMPRHIAKWDSTAQRWNNISFLREFAQQRPVWHRSITKKEFSLKNQFNVKLKINIPGAGKLKISTLTIAQLPWQGVYFTDVPLPIKALANTGYKFAGWKQATYKDSSASMSIYITGDTELEAVFSSVSEYTDDIVINEIMYRPVSETDSKDWFELYNRLDKAIDIGGWYFSDDNDSHRFDFKNTVISPDDYLVVCEDTSEFLNIYPDKKNIIGNFNFGLSRADKIRLYNAKDELTDIVEYSNELPWPLGADGTGYSIELINAVDDNNLASNWIVSSILHGTPLERNSITDVPNANGSDDSYSIYPNPADDDLYIVSRNAISTNIKDITFYDSQGRQINISRNGISTNSSPENYIYSFDIRNLPDGIYFCRFELSSINQGYIIYPFVIRR